MTRGLIALVAGVALTVGAPSTSGMAAQDRVLRILSYNIHHGEGTDGEIDLERIAAVIRASRADIVALQEVDRMATRTGGVDQAAELARLTGLHMAFGQTIPLQGGQYGNAVLSRWPIDRATNHRLPSPAGGEARAVLVADIPLPGGQDVRVLATHFHHTQDESNRVASASAIEELFPADAGAPEGATPMLLVGDLNATPDSRPLEMLRRSWSMADAQGLAPTSPAPAPRRKIDYVLYRPGVRWRLVEARVIDEAVASDHRPLLAVLELLPPG